MKIANRLILFEIFQISFTKKKIEHIHAHCAKLRKSRGKSCGGSVKILEHSCKASFGTHKLLFKYVV